LGGDDAAAESAASEALAASAASGARGFAAAALDELAVSAARRGQFERAARLFGAAAAERGRRGATAWRWPVLPPYEDDIAAVRLALGDDGLAVEHDAGASMTLDEAARLALRGKGGRRRPRSGWDSLTPTELEVVRLVREGLSNPAIAEKLLVTRGTVKVHLSHVFTKLGISSRAELAAEAARRRLS
jgi:DNA-binding CsgD family transcriptional regulator